MHYPSKERESMQPETADEKTTVTVPAHVVNVADDGDDDDDDDDDNVPEGVSRYAFLY